MHDSLTIALLQAREAAMAHFRPIVKRHNLTEQQWRIVRILAENPSMDFHDLAFRACILRPSLTGILTRMERDGLVLRLKPVNDQRKLYVSLTPAGLKLYESAQAQVEYSPGRAVLTGATGRCHPVARIRRQPPSGEFPAAQNKVSSSSSTLYCSFTSSRVFHLSNVRHGCEVPNTRISPTCTSLPGARRSIQC